MTHTPPSSPHEPRSARASSPAPPTRPGGPAPRPRGPRARMLVLLAALLTACGAGAGSPDTTPRHGEAPVDRSGPAGHDEVCSAYDGSFERPCAAGLSCCYPCGVDGCDSVCHTEEECGVDMMRP